MTKDKKYLPMVKQYSPHTSTFFSPKNSQFTALQEGQDILSKAGAIGFDWPDWKPVIDKIYEETNEIIEAIENKEPFHRIEEELGDLLIVIINLARHLEVDAETAAQKANAKFERRFIQVLDRLKQTNPDTEEWTLQGMQEAWEIIKEQEKL